MSCYNWEKGQVKIPAKDWPTLKKVVRDAHNTYQTMLYMRSLALYDTVKNAGKSKRNFDFMAAERSVRWDSGTSAFNDVWLSYNDAGKPLKPKKKDFLLATSTTTSYVFSDAQIGFINKERIVEWYVGENNRAVEHSREHPVGKAFFVALGKITWTTKTGGVFVGNDEYNRDNDYHGGGANYITGTYGGIGKRQRGY